MAEITAPSWVQVLGRFRPVIGEYLLSKVGAGPPTPIMKQLCSGSVTKEADAKNDITPVLVDAFTLDFLAMKMASYPLNRRRAW